MLCVAAEWVCYRRAVSGILNNALNRQDYLDKAPTKVPRRPNIIKLLLVERIPVIVVAKIFLFFLHYFINNWWFILAVPRP